MFGKMIAGFFGMVALVVLFYVWAISTIFNVVDEGIDDLEVLVGQEIVIKGDTLEILDYSLIESNYTLDDGRTVSYEYAKKKLLKTK